MQHEPAHSSVLAYFAENERHSMFSRLPMEANKDHAEDRRTLLAFTRELSSDYAGHRLTFVRFAQAPHFDHLAAVCGTFGFSGSLDVVRSAAGLSDEVNRLP